MNTVIDETITKQKNAQIITTNKSLLDLQVHNYIESKKSNNIYKFILLFFTFSILGWIIETLYSYVVLGYFDNRGFLNGPLCPIYGFGGIILILFLDQYKKNPLKLFLYSIFIFTVFEYVVSFLLDALFNQKYWDYTNDFLNINGRVSLFYSFAWGIFALVFSNFVCPIIDKAYSKVLEKINTKALFVISSILIVLFMVDVIYTSIQAWL